MLPDTTINLFDEEMKYLHANGFRVLTLNQIGYDTTHDVLYIKKISLLELQAGLLVELQLRDDRFFFYFRLT